MSGLLGTVDRWDRQAVVATARLHHPVATRALVLVTESGRSAVWFSLGAVLTVTSFTWPEPRLRGFLAGMAAAGAALVIGEILKKLVDRRRPYEVIDGLRPLTRKPHNTSMPSTHAATSVALATWLVASGHVLAPVVALWSAAVVWSRYYLGVHYPSDLVGGTALGMIAALAVDWGTVVGACLG